MQQPPHGRGAGQPYRPPAGGRPGGPPPPAAGPAQTRPPLPQQPPVPQQPPRSAAPPYQAPPPHPQEAFGSYGPASAPLAPPVQRKKRGSLRFLAASCVFTAWLTLIVSVILAGFSLVSGFAASQAVAALPAPSTEYFPTPAPSTQAPGLEDLGLPSPGNILGGGAPSPAGGGLAGMMTMFRTVVPFLYFGSAAFTVVTGVITFLLFLGLGQACYAILDLEDQAVRNEQTLQLILARLSGGR